MQIWARSFGERRKRWEGDGKVLSGWDSSHSALHAISEAQLVQALTTPGSTPLPTNDISLPHAQRLFTTASFSYPEWLSWFVIAMFDKLSGVFGVSLVDAG